MKKVVICAFAFAAAIVAYAFDNTVVNDFWDTTGYVNGTTSTRSAALGSGVDSRVKVVRETAAPQRFSTYNGTLFIFR